MHEMNYSPRTNVVLAIAGLNPMTVSIPQDAEEMHMLGMVTSWIPNAGIILEVTPVEMQLSYN